MNEPADGEVTLLAHLAERVRADHTILASTWMSRLQALLGVSVNGVFPGQKLLDHIPRLILEIADRLTDEASNRMTGAPGVVSKAAELGDLRFEQGASVHQVLLEYDLLADIMAEFVAAELESSYANATPADAVRAVAHLRRAIRFLQGHTVDRFVARYTDLVSVRTNQLRDFNALISHEIRQPLDVLAVSARVLREDPAGSHLEVLERNVERLGSIIARLESLARLREPSGDRLVEQAIELDRILVDVVRERQSMASDLGVTIDVRSPLPVLRADPTRLELVFGNLLSNAIKYSDAGKPERWVRVYEGDADDSVVRVCVEDNGVGIPDDQVANVFKRFVRGARHAGDPEGLGLGLALVRESMLLMDGDIDLHTREGEGLTVTLSWRRSRRLAPPVVVGTED